jgi:hypothetical protein
VGPSRGRFSFGGLAILLLMSEPKDHGFASPLRGCFIGGDSSTYYHGTNIVIVIYLLV